jgi:hypothetical protein
MLRSDQCANLRLRPKLHSTPPPGIMTPETCRPRCCSNAGRDDTSWKQRLSSIMANRPDNQSSSAPAVATTREGLIRHDKSASGLSAMRRSIWTGLRLARILDCEKYKLDRPLAQAPAKLPHEWGFPAQRIRHQ